MDANKEDDEKYLPHHLNEVALIFLFCKGR
jgi:hypothetical protein